MATDLLVPSRRGLLKAAAGLVAFPAIVRAESLMKVVAVNPYEEYGRRISWHCHWEALAREFMPHDYGEAFGFPDYSQGVPMPRHRVLLPPSRR